MSHVELPVQEKNDPGSIDFSELRISNAASPHFQPQEQIQITSKILIKKVEFMSYDELLVQAKNDPGSIDFTELRISYVTSGEYRPNDPSRISSKIFIKLDIEEGNLHDAIEKIYGVLDDYYLDYEAHSLASVILAELGDREKALYHREFARGIFNSILQSGNGQSFEKAFKVVDICEEFFIINAYDLKYISKVSLEHDGHAYDVIKYYKTKTGASGKIHFNIDYIADWMKKNMESPEE